MNITQEFIRVFDIEINELIKVRDSITAEIEPIVSLIHNCNGKVVLSGMGKPGHIARKISATMSSLGIHSYFLHPAEGLHGDLGTLTAEDVIIILSNSGETAEICKLLPNIKMIGTPIIAITSYSESTLAKFSDYVLTLPAIQEACSLNLAPTSSTTVEIVIGDALAVVLSGMLKFKKENFALYHPAGSLGKNLTTKVEDIMHSGYENAIIGFNSSLLTAINEMTKKGLGAVVIVDDENKLCGIITDGDLRRCMNNKTDIYQCTVNEVMTKNPICVTEKTLAVDALKLMENRDRQISVLPVINDKNEPVGLIQNHDIIKQNIFI